MKILIALLISLSLVSTANAATAYWTGKVKIAQSVTGASVFNCEYMYAGNYFWRAFQYNCQNSVEVY